MAQRPGSMTNGSPAGNSTHASLNEAERLQHQIADTRASMSQTIDAIQDRLKPRNIVNRTMESVKDKTVKQAQTLSDTATSTARLAFEKSRTPRHQMMRMARQNPGAAVLIGAAAGWLLIRALSVRPEHYY